MADFLEREADESEDSGDDTTSNQKVIKRRNFEDSDEEEDDDEDELNEIKNDLINDEEEDVEESDDDVNVKRKHEEDLEENLDEDDYALLEENLGVRLNRKKKLKRVKRIVDAESDDEDHDNEDREAIANELFDGDDEGIKQNRKHEEQSTDDRYGTMLSGSEESEEDNFIVDDNDRPISKPRKKKGHRYTDEAMQQAQDVFGVDFDFEELENIEEGDYDEEEDEEEYEDEAREGQRSSKKKTRSKRKSSRKSIFEIYEPSELERSHLTDFDNEIRGTDFPERFQLRSTPVTNADEAEIEEEADWIHNNAFGGQTISEQNDPDDTVVGATSSNHLAVILKIREALKFMRNQLFEVPFIAFYRKEYVRPELTINDLWTVYHWDEKWVQLQQKKNNIVKLFKNMQQFQNNRVLVDENAFENMRLIGDQEIEKISNVTNLKDLRDYWFEFQLYYSCDLTSMKQENLNKERDRRLEHITEGDADKALQEEELAINSRLSTIRLAQRKDPYTICREAGITEISKCVGLTPEQFGENIQNMYQRHEIEQYHEQIGVLADRFICARFATRETVLDVAKFVIAKQISCNPLVRQCVRKEFFEKAKVHCKPTKKGIKEIDEGHSCFTQKYLRNKPVSKFIDDAFLQLVIAQNDGLLTLRISLDEEDRTDPEKISHVKTYFQEISAFYQKDEVASKVIEWNKLRVDALKIALEKFLYPVYEKEIKEKLLQESKQFVLKNCTKKIRDWLKVAPYNVKAEVSDAEDFDVRYGVRVMAVAFSSDEESPTFAVIIDGNGDVIDHLRLPYFMYKRFGFKTDKEKEYIERDKRKLKNFIENRKPHVITIGAESMLTREAIKDFDAMVTDLHENNFDGDGFPLIPCEISDNELSCVYMNCKRAITEFHDYPPLLRQAVSLARRLQDPLIEFSQLCTADEEILCLKFNYLQDHLSKEELLQAINIEFINRVNEVGVDINRAIEHPYSAQLVQFVCGLGPRKGAALLRTLKKQHCPLLENRTQLVMNCQIGAKVFINCAGFIKLDTAQLSESGTDTYIEVLDSTRVHPEAYEWARKMAVDALEYDDENDQNPAGALEEILDNPEKLKDLDLDAFAEELERQGFGDKRITLYDIRDELNNRYKDLRTLYESATSEEVFLLLTKETPQTLYNGKLVMALVTGISRKKLIQEQQDTAEPKRSEDAEGLWSCPFCLKMDFPELSDVWAHFDAQECPGEATGIKLRLDNGLYGHIETNLISDSEIKDPSERVHVGMTIHARITKINADKFGVDLTCRTKDLMDTYHNWIPVKDVEYDYEMEDFDKKDDDNKKKQNRQTYIKRIIVHPSFHNIDYKQAEKILRDLDQGEAIIRPSSKGNDHLTLTWKVAGNINQHVDILEEGKDNVFSLGHQLYIGGEAYEDLDEIIARYVHPMANHARDLLNFKYFRTADGGKREEMEKILTEEKKKQPSKIHYFISASKEYPGKFLLSYLPRHKVLHEYVSVSAEGFRYRKNTFRSINELFSWFKEHFRDPIPQTPVATPAGQTPLEAGQGSNETPNINQVIQRAAAAMPPSMFNTLSQVTGQTPSFSNSGSNYNQQTNYYPQSSSASNNLTPGYGINNQVTTREFPSTPQQNSQWNNSSMPPPTQLPHRQSTGNASSTPGRNRSRSGADWSHQAESWTKRSQRNTSSALPKTPLYATPGASSQMSISPNASPSFNKGDQTPLEDEW